jgi:hypothetical protein
MYLVKKMWYIILALPLISVKESNCHGAWFVFIFNINYTVPGFVMIQMLFFLRFRSQLRRTRPELIADLDDTVVRAVTEAGGQFTHSRRYISVSFNEEKPAARWLDLIVLLETVHKALKKAAEDLYGHALILGSDIGEYAASELCRSFSAASCMEYTGIWCSRNIQTHLESYGVFENSADKRFKDYGELKKFKKPEAWPPTTVFPCSEKIERALIKGGDKNTIVLGPEFIGKRKGLYQYCAGLSRKIPPLAIRFGVGGRGLVCFADALSPEIFSFLSGPAAETPVPAGTLRELESLRVLLFRERLREEMSPYMLGEGRRFLKLLLLAYGAAARPPAVIIIENPEAAADEGVLVFNEIFDSLEDRKNYRVLAVSGATEDENLKNWKRIFPRMLKYTAEDHPAMEKADMPEDLWEIGYCIALLRRYFPASSFADLFEEEGIHPSVYRKALALLTTMGAVDMADDPRLRIPDFISLAEAVLGGKKEIIRSMVRNRLLAWVDSGRLRPCFNLLRIIAELGGEAGIVTVLKSLRGDVFNGTCEGIEEAVRQRYFACLTEPKNARGAAQSNASSFLWVYKTLKALTSLGIREIHAAFSDAPPQDLHNSSLRFQILANRISFSLGIRDIAAASQAVKEAMLLSRELKGGASASYRYFALVNILKQRLDDAPEYISFAMEQAEKAGLDEELVLSACFAASAEFLCGNLSKAARFTLKAEEAAVKFGHIEWAEWARFLRGKIRFETGYYADALEIFNSLAAQPGGKAASLALKQATIAAWAARAASFLKGGESAFYAGPPEKTSCSDGPLFEIEAAYFAGNYDRAEDLAKKWRAGACASADDDFLFTEQPDWRSGFAQCELLLIPGGIFRNRFVSVYQALTRSSLETSKAGKERLVTNVRQLLREDFLVNTDPNEVFYLYAYYRILKETGAAQVDLNTAVSMAFKRLQRRAGRIDDDDARQTFLTRHHWNGALSLAAREYKLI